MTGEDNGVTRVYRVVVIFRVTTQKRDKNLLFVSPDASASSSLRPLRPHLRLQTCPAGTTAGRRRPALLF